MLFKIVHSRNFRTYCFQYIFVRIYGKPAKDNSVLQSTVLKGNTLCHELRLRNALILKLRGSKPRSVPCVLALVMICECEKCLFTFLR